MIVMQAIWVGRITCLYLQSIACENTQYGLKIRASGITTTTAPFRKMFADRMAVAHSGKSSAAVYFIVCESDIFNNTHLSYLTI